MFAVVAAVCFLLALVGVHVGHLDLVVLGLLFVAVHLALPIWWSGNRVVVRRN